MLRRIALWGPLLIAAVLAGGYITLHQPFARDGTKLLAVPLSEQDAALDRVGSLTFLGGLDLPRMGQNLGGLSALRWDAASGRLLALTDDARWVWIPPDEENGRLVGIREIKVGDLLGLEGERLSGKNQGDSESLTRSAKGGWLVGFERDHRIWRYPTLDSVPEETAINPLTALGALESNGGLEAMARDENNLILCAERPVSSERSNCAIHFAGSDIAAPFAAQPSSELAALGAVPTDADRSESGTLFFLFRSYSPANGSGASIVAFPEWGERAELADLRPPLSVDNFEGIAVREEGDRTFLYIVSDDNFSSNQRTLLMKFEVTPPAE